MGESRARIKSGNFRSLCFETRACVLEVFFFLYRRAVIGVAISRVYFSPNFPVYIFSANL